VPKFGDREESNRFRAGYITKRYLLFRMNYSKALLLLISLITVAVDSRSQSAPAYKWEKSEKNPLVIFKGNLKAAPKNCLNSPVVLRIDDRKYKKFKWAFLHLDTDPTTNRNFLSVSFATDKGFEQEHWENELKIQDKLVEPFDVKIIDGKIYLWGTWPMEHKDHTSVSVMVSDDWEHWSVPEVAIRHDKPWKAGRVRGFTLQKSRDNEFLAFYCGQSEYEGDKGANGPFTIGKATASLQQIKANRWVEEPSNPVLTANDISWKTRDVVLYPRLMTQCSGGRWIMAMATYLKQVERLSVGFVYSENKGASWKEYLPGTNPVLQTGPEAWDEGYVSTPYIIRTGATSFKMYYGGRPTLMKYHAIGVAYLKHGFTDCYTTE
jgi:hypothetical protein